MKTKTIEKRKHYQIARTVDPNNVANPQICIWGIGIRLKEKNILKI